MKIDKETNGLENVFKPEFDKMVGKSYSKVYDEITSKLNSVYGRPCTIPIMENQTSRIYVGWLNKGFWKFTFRGQKLHDYKWYIPSVVFMNT